MSVTLPAFQQGDEVIADIVRGGQTLTLPGVVQATCGDQVYVKFPSRLVQVGGRKVRDVIRQRDPIWIPDWEWLPAERVYADPYAKLG